jgi:drug/metabolite transporter (DMT)-like permease
VVRCRHQEPRLGEDRLDGQARDFYNVALSYGQVSVPAATASFLVASAPVWMAIISFLRFRERLTGWGWAGIALSFAGVAVIALGRSGGLHLEGRAVVILIAAAAQALYSMGQKRFVGRYTALEFTAYAIWFGTLFLLPLGAGLPSAVAAAPLSATLAVI